ncbi:MAG: hypothetical protein DCF29_08035 [Alphaproteobacteria bacterium]|nr:MAG: hypothetical protein DCF29_08035 [Alphaproteobacteria bacterium]
MSRTPYVSDHALLRWMERYLEMDLEAIRASILTDDRRAAIEAGASAIHCCPENMILMVAPCGTVTTAFTRTMSRRRSRGQEAALGATARRGRK